MLGFSNRTFGSRNWRFAVKAANFPRLTAFIALTAIISASILAPVRGQVQTKFAQAGPPVAVNSLVNKVASKMSNRSFSALMAKSSTKAPSAKAAAADGVTYAVLNVEFKNAAARRAAFTDVRTSTIPNAFVITTIDKFADVFVSTQQAWEAILNNASVLRAEDVARVTPPPPPRGVPSPYKTQGVPESIIRGGYKGLTGKKVNVAILDTGLDFRHPDFATNDASGRPVSRLKYLWDTSLEYQPGRGSPAPYKYPNGTSIGTLFTRDQLTAELRSRTVNIPPTDEDGHGTACASIAAGNGNADRLSTGLKRAVVNGVAPDADIIGVRMGPAGNEFANSFMLGAIAEWLDRAAAAQPLVISGSFGGHYTAHDGQSVFERQLDARFPLTKASRAIVFAAGNEGSDRIHSKVQFAGEATPVTWNASQATEINLYFNSNENYLIYGTDWTPINKDTMSIELNPITNQYLAHIAVNPGNGAIWLKNNVGHSSEADLYFYNSEVGAFSNESATYNSLVGTPGTMGNAITVGSYDWNDNFSVGGKVVNLTDSCGYGKNLEIGWLSCYSSPGPRRTSAGSPRVVKPDIVSPGEYYASANALVNGQSAGWGSLTGYTDSTGYYRKMNGTSAATPYTAGVIALLFEKKPLLTLGRIKDLLRQFASTTGLNPSIAGPPNNNWGNGKLDLAAIDRILADIARR